MVIVALDDDLLEQAHVHFQASYPKLEFLKCGVNLGATDPEGMKLWWCCSC